MGLDLPNLADREYEELIDEARKLIPAYSDDWTNYNPNDPGIAILEILAWLTETYTYQLDQITDGHRSKYLQLMGESPRPPDVSTARLALQLPATHDSVRIPVGRALTVVDGSGTEKGFEIDHDLVLTTASVQTVIDDRGVTVTEHRPTATTGSDFFRPFGADPRPGSTVHLGFDGDPFQGAEELRLTIAYYDADLPPPADHGDEEPWFEPSVATIWEYCVNYHNWRDDEAWRPFSAVNDGTDHLYHGGAVTIPRPDEWHPDTWGIDDVSVADEDPGKIWIRCRVDQGGYEIPPRLRWIGVNVLEASHRTTVRNETLSRARSGRPPTDLSAKRYRFENAPVLEADIRVNDERWTAVDDFDAAGPTEECYVLDGTAGEIQFGDGVHGKSPPADATVLASRYVHGGGVDGNVSESSSWRFTEPDATVGDLSLDEITIEPIGPATGGAAAESIDGAFRRVKRELRTPFRCVTTDDIEYVAMHTPGLRIGRTAVSLTQRSAGSAADGIPDATVVVVPYAPAGQGHPEPSDGFIRAVQRHLDHHRLLTDRVTVVSPTYVGIRVELSVRTTHRIPYQRSRSVIASSIASYLDPNHGFEGEGWPFGRPLHPDDLTDLIHSIDWIDDIATLSVDARGNATIGGDGTIRIDDTALFHLDRLNLTIRTVTDTEPERRGDQP